MGFLGSGSFASGRTGWRPPGHGSDPSLRWWLNAGYWDAPFGSIARWHDLSGYGTDALQLTPAFRPARDVVNGLEIARFIRDSEDRMRADALVDLVNGTDVPYVLAGVLRSSVLKNNGTVFGFGDSTESTTNNLQHQLCHATSNTWRILRAVNIFSDAADRQTVAVADDEWHGFVIEFTGTTISMRIDGTSQSFSPSASMDTSGSLACDTFTLGAMTHTSLSRPWFGDAREILAYSGTISSGYRDEIEGHFSTLVAALSA